MACLTLEKMGNVNACVATIGGGTAIRLVYIDMKYEHIILALKKEYTSNQKMLEDRDAPDSERLYAMLKQIGYEQELLGLRRKKVHS